MSVRKVLRTAGMTGRVLKMLADARTSQTGIIGYTMVAMGIVDMVVDYFIPRCSFDYLQQEGFKPLSPALSTLLLPWIPQGIETEFSETDRVYVSDHVAIQRDSAGVVVWIHKNHGVQEEVAKAIASMGDEVAIVKTTEGYELRKLPELGALVGQEYTPEYVCAGMQKREITKGVVVLLGATGSGKTVLARSTLRKFPGVTILVNARSLFDSEFTNLLHQVLDVVHPRGVILDDIQCILNREEDLMLPILDGLRGKTLVFATYMQDSYRASGATKELRRFIDAWKKRKDGVKTAMFSMENWYIAGFRPGRADWILRFSPPNAAERRAILTHYAGHGIPADVMPTVVTMTGGLTGAFLMAIGQQLRTADFSGDDWIYTIAEIRAMSPTLQCAEEAAQLRRRNANAIQRPRKKKLPMSPPEENFSQDA